LDTNELRLIEDFAHHPTAIRSTLNGVKKRYPQSRLIAAIELRSNTMKSGYHDNSLTESVVDADMVFWRSEDEQQAKKLTTENPSKFFQISDVDIFVKDFEALSKEGDILLVMSNGDFSDLSNKVIERFKNE